MQTTRLREEARAAIKAAVGADESYSLVFTGSGCTGAIDKLVGCLNLRLPADLDAAYGLRTAIPPSERPVVFIGPYEHHSNELPWRESIADVVTIREDLSGHVDLTHLRAELDRFADRSLKIGSFSAASNVTGILTACDEIAALLHEHGALSFWDYAAAAPYVGIRMTAPEHDPTAYKDAAFLSPHKFIGGPSTPGILVVRTGLVTNSVPDVVGGGTVAFVNPDSHEYLADAEHREEGGTPAIVESIRAGLVFLLKEAVGSAVIEELERDWTRRAIATWEQHPGIELLGNTHTDRLSIVSFVVHSPDGTPLHHNFVVAVLNDLFGIQSRGGCSCAGPYGHRLLGIDPARSLELEREIAAGCEGIKPGWVRVNFNYFLAEEVFTYLVSAVALVASLGHRLLPSYRFEPVTGLWRHEAGAPDPPLSLADVRFGPDGPILPDDLPRAGVAALPTYLDEARALLESLPDPQPSELTGQVSADFEALRWFRLPAECLLPASADDAKPLGDAAR